jgi:site-specific recombinase XerD
MYLSKRQNGFWYIFYTQQNGKKTCVSTGSKIKSEGIRFLSNFQSELKIKQQNKVIPITLQEYEIQFLKYSESVHSDNTSKVFKVTFNFLKEYFGSIQLSDLNHQKLDSYFQDRIKKKGSIYPARKDLINLSSAFNHAIKMGYLIENPCKGFKRFKIPEKMPVFFSEIDFLVLVRNIENQDMKDIVNFAVNTGLRQMEILTLEWNQINFIEKSLILDNRNYLTKSKKVRTIPLNITALQILTGREINKKSKFIFTMDGEPIKQDYISKKFREYVNSAGLSKELHFHSLRHTFASWLVQKGVSIYSVSKLLGHSDIKVTAIYSHLRAEDLMSSVNKLNN